MNAELSGGRNALHFAADYGQTDVIQCLLAAGADINVSMLEFFPKNMVTILKKGTICTRVQRKKCAVMPCYKR